MAAFLAVLDLAEALAADLAAFVLAGAFLAAAGLGFTEDMRFLGAALGSSTTGGLSYSEEIPLEVIEYGDPDQTGRDLKANNEVLLRAESFIGWGVLDAKAFARIKAPAE